MPEVTCFANLSAIAVCRLLSLTISPSPRSPLVAHRSPLHRPLLDALAQRWYLTTLDDQVPILDLVFILVEAAGRGAGRMGTVLVENTTVTGAHEQSGFGEPSHRAAEVRTVDREDLELMNRFNIFGLPAILFFDRNGNEIRGLRAEGFEDADTFSTRVEAAFH